MYKVLQETGEGSQWLLPGLGKTLTSEEELTRLGRERHVQKPEASVNNVDMRKVIGEQVWPLHTNHLNSPPRGVLQGQIPVSYFCPMPSPI